MKINYLQIHDYNLDISKRLNECVNLLPNEWICLTDNDVLKFPTFSDNLRDILESGDCKKNHVIGTMTNRLRPSNPQVVNELFDESDMNVHFNKSVELWDENGTTLMDAPLIAGSCMVFHKSLWSKVGGFDESKTFFDKYFSYAVKDSGGRCLIAKGLYTFHLYRWGSKSPVDAVEHLIK